LLNIHRAQEYNKCLIITATCHSRLSAISILLPATTVFPPSPQSFPKRWMRSLSSQDVLLKFTRIYM